MGQLTLPESGLVYLDASPIPIHIAVLEAAARVRAATGVRTSDAIHAATALATGCNLFVTNDGDFRRLPDLPIVVLSEVTNR